MINSEDIKESVVKKLLEVFPRTKVYKESISNPIYPHFFVNQINIQDIEDRKNYHILTYSMAVRYRVASDPSTDLKLQQDLDEISLLLLQKFNVLDFNDSKVRCYNKSAEKVDGVLHFLFNIDLVAYDKPEKENSKMKKLIYTMGVKE